MNNPWWIMAIPGYALLMYAWFWRIDKKFEAEQKKRWDSLDKLRQQHNEAMRAHLLAELDKPKP